METLNLNFHVKSKEKVQMLLDHLNTSTTFSAELQITQEGIERVSATLNVQFYKERFLVKAGNRLHSIESSAIAYFIAKEGSLFIQTKTGVFYKYNDTLYAVVKEVNPKRFFLVNRSLLVAYDSISSITCTDGRLYLDVLPSIGEEIMVSRERISSFREWLGL